MMPLLNRPAAASVTLPAAFLLAVGLAALAAPAEAKDPPACAAISFRPLAAGGPDGEQDAGLYKSRFGKIEVKADVKGGQATNYYMVLNGKKVDGSTTPPKLSDACLKSKHVKLPFAKQASGACTGSRFRVVVDRSSGKPVAAFFGLQGEDWAYCSATAL
ncbi:hypothetical protein [Azospirillum picis]|uniref:Uncharacterized protein n=1 Tax=Azospirillum picis TaxID=488438 RepID=A0ABU0MK76_9PROT|nr:hypothetical protein [Azospirillum picis]MBP2300074.1 hypothetical protein [Azospirillum picis]MDQ0533688.1 hypothetical protein [Azospirillum picis]